MKIRSIKLFKKIFVFLVILAVAGLLPFGGKIQADDPSLLICIDPGHGGRDPGAIGPTGLTEKEVNLDIAFRLKSKLISGGYRVIMTRESDVYRSLDERVQFANSNRADIFISVHNNAFTLPTPNGTETYYSTYSPAQSKTLATDVHNAVLGQINTTNRGVKTANFYVIKNTHMVSCLLEGVFISNPTEEARLKDAGFRDKIATGIFNGIKEFAGAVSIAPYRAQIDDLGNTPQNMYPGEVKTFDIKVKNLSTSFIWPADGTNLVNISYHLYDKYENLVKFDGRRSPLPHDVGPGETVTIPVTISAPEDSGEYKIEYDVVHEWVTWFSDRGSETLWKDFTVIDEGSLIEFLSNLYEFILDRTYQQDKFDLLAGDLRSGSATASSVISSFVRSEDFQNRNLTDQEFISTLYRALFDREPDNAGNEFWLSQLSEGNSRQYVLSKFIISAEFANVCGECGIEIGSLDQDVTIKDFHSDDNSGSEEDDVIVDLPVEDGLSLFINNLFSQFLGRECEGQELDDWTARLTSGDNTASDLVISIMSGDEFNAQLSDQEFIDAVYGGLLDRIPDSSGSAYWLSQLSNGKTWEYILSKFIGSGEFGSICEELGIESGELDIKLLFFINNLFSQFLGRDTEGQELDDWTARLTSGDSTASDLVISIMSGDEFNTQLSDQEFIDLVYRGLLDRVPDSSGSAYWLSQLSDGKTREYILSNFIRSGEFGNICESYGIEAGGLDESQVIFGENSGEGESDEDDSGQIPAEEPEEDSLSAFINIIYQQFLGRECSEQELQDWENGFTSGDDSVSDLILSLFSSDEFDQDMSDQDFINMAYQSLLGRETDSGGLAYWLDKLSNGYGRLNVLADFVGSQEFVEICSGHSIDPGTIEIDIEQEVIEYSTIINDTSIIGLSPATEEMMMEMFINYNPSQEQRARRIVKYYIQYCQLFNLRADIAWAQMCHETGFLGYTGIVPPDANNFCGLGATGAKDADGNYVYNTFSTEELGVIAHLMHLAWYVYPGHLDLKDSNGDLYCSSKYDPRHFGSVHYFNGDNDLSCLNGRWAPSPTYTDKIIQFANEIYGN